MPRLLKILVLALTVALVCVPSASAAKRKVPAGFFATVFDGKTEGASDKAQEKQFDLMARSGVESIRLLFPWAAMQPRKGDKPDFTGTDRSILQASRRGIAVLPSILYTPYWAREYKKRAFSPPKKNSYYTDFLAAAIKRYGSHGTFWKDNPDLYKQPVREWQIWNEPNIRSYWDASPKTSYGWPQGYGRLLTAAHKTIKKADPRAKTVFAGLTGIAWLDMRRAYDRGKIRGQFDIAALQVYPQTVDREIEAIGRLRAELVRGGDRKVHMYVTEVAFPASRGKVRPINHQQQETPNSMAQKLGNLYDRLARNRGKFLLDRIYWYTWNSRYGKSRSNFDFSGLVASATGEKYKAQPALSTFQRIARRYEGCAKSSSGACR